MITEFKNLNIDEVVEIITSAGISEYRAHQILTWVYEKHVSSYEEMTNLPKVMREQLSELYPLHSAEVVTSQLSQDGCKKYLVRYHDGASVETVAIPLTDNRFSVCISSQAGCAMNCSFCATGKGGLTRNLYPGEIIDQLIIASEDFDKHISNVVIMGQGEPFANFNSVAAALQIMNNEKLLNIGARHITVSTCGIIDGIRKFADISEQYTLAVSLHSAVQRTRDLLMPAMKNQPLDELRASLIEYSSKTGRRYTFEYALMRGVNDGDDALQSLLAYCRGLLCHVNLIPLNHIEGSEFKPVKRSILEKWCETLNKNGIAATIRDSRGQDIDAACGQLANKAL